MEAKRRWKNSRQRDLPRVQRPWDTWGRCNVWCVWSYIQKSMGCLPYIRKCKNILTSRALQVHSESSRNLRKLKQPQNTHFATMNTKRVKCLQYFHVCSTFNFQNTFTSILFPLLQSKVCGYSLIPEEREAQGGQKIVHISRQPTQHFYSIPV